MSCARLGKQTASLMLCSGFRLELHAAVLTPSSVQCFPSAKAKKGSIEENEENCNLNIHKALCLLPPIGVRTRSCYSAVDFGNYLSL